jgi:hypothetical protein
MSLRNFWLKASIDGRATELTGGPRAKDGKMVASIYARDKGESVKFVEVECLPVFDGGELTNRLCIAVCVRRDDGFMHTVYLKEAIER